jgi:hypothetical protein
MNTEYNQKRLWKINPYINNYYTTAYNGDKNTPTDHSQKAHRIAHVPTQLSAQKTTKGNPDFPEDTPPTASPSCTPPQKDDITKDTAPSTRKASYPLLLQKELTPREFIPA